MRNYFEKSKMLESVPEFLELYSLRPIQVNKGGMGLNHSWATWYLVKELEPELIIESGVWKGHSTWLLESAAPNADLICFDTSLNNREFISQKAKYFERDFSEFNWSNFDLTKALIFLDDHQNHYERLIRGHWFGFKHFILEDVYPVNEGDFYSLKHIQAGVGSTSLNMSARFQGTRRARRKRRKKEKFLREFQGNQLHLITPNQNDWENLKTKVKILEEMPPLYLREKNLWGMDYTGNYQTKAPLLLEAPTGEFDLSYNYLTYVELV
jgi:hypothetical protein